MQACRPYCAANRFHIRAPDKPPSHVDQTDALNREAPTVQSIQTTVSEELPDRVALEATHAALDLLEGSIDQQVAVRPADRTIPPKTGL